MSVHGKYYVSLGAGENQILLIEAAKELGLQVIGVDQNLKALGFNLCDLRIEESILNYRKIHKKLMMLMLSEDIAGGYAAGYGRALLSWAYIAERYRLNSLSRTQAEVLLDKYSVREKLSNLDNQFFAQPRYLAVTEKMLRDDIEVLRFPLILKTVSGHSKENIFMAKSYSEIKKMLTKRFLRSLGLTATQFILEEFIEGDEVTVVGLVENFKYHLVSLSDKVTQKTSPFIELEHNYPSRFSDSVEELQSIHQDIVNTLNITATPIVSEFKYMGGKWYLIEMSPQVPGEFIGNFIIPKALKYDFYQNLVKLNLGLPIELPPLLKRRKKNAKVKYWDKRVSIEEWEAQKKNAFFAKIINEYPQRPPKSNADRFGVMGFLD